MALQPADEIAHFGQRNAVLGIEPLGLDVDDVEAEFVLLDDAVDAAVADPAQRPAHLRASAAVAHPHQKVDDEVLEERRTEGMNPPDDLSRQLGIEELETGGDQFLRALLHARFFLDLARLGLGPPGDELRITPEQPEVDLADALGEQLPPAVSGATVAAS